MKQGGEEEQKRIVPIYRPFGDPKEDLPGEGTKFRRLFKLRYVCDLCGKKHDVESYLTQEAGSLDEFREKAMRAFSDPEHGKELAKRYAVAWHESGGDLERRLRNLRGRSRRAEIVYVEMTEESDYTCGDCGLVFPTIGEYRLHAGVNLRTGLTEGVPVCLASRN